MLPRYDTPLTAEEHSEMMRVRDRVSDPQRFGDIRKRLKTKGLARIVVTSSPRESMEIADASMLLAPHEESRRRFSELVGIDCVAVSDCVLQCSPYFTRGLSRADLDMLIEHELRHAVEIKERSVLSHVEFDIQGSVDLFSMILGHLKRGVSHYYLRRHAWEEGAREFVRHDIDAVLFKNMGALGMLDDIKRSWLGIYIGAILETAFVYRHVGEDHSSRTAAGLVRAKIKHVMSGSHRMSLDRVKKLIGFEWRHRENPVVAQTMLMQVMIFLQRPPSFSPDEMFAEGDQFLERIQAVLNTWKRDSEAGAERLDMTDMFAIMEELSRSRYS